MLKITIKCKNFVIISMMHLHHLHNKRRYVSLSVYLSVADGRPNGWADQDQTLHRECYSQGQGHLSMRAV